MTLPLITIGMACYNAEKTMARALDCALAQDYPNTEILVVDDCSSDHSVEIIAEYAKKYPRIKHIRHKENMGFASALNTMLDNFSGEYIAFFDDDDVSLPERLTKQYERLASFHSDFALCWGNLRLVSPRGEDLGQTWFGIGRKAPEPHGAAATHFFLTGKGDPDYWWGITGTCALMGHRETFERIGKYDLTMYRGQDLEFATRASTLGCYFVSVDEVLLDYCYDEGTFQNTARCWGTHCRIAHKYRHVVPVSQMKFFKGDECKYLCTVLKRKRDVRAYLRGIWTLLKLSPVAGMKFFFRPKNLLRLLRVPFVTLYKKIFNR